MSIRAAIRASIVIVAAAGMTLAVAAPASAAGNSLPATDALYAFSCDSEGTPSILRVSAETGESSGIGSATGDCKYNSAYDEVTGKVFFNDYDVDALSTVDVATGVFTQGPAFTLDGLPLTIDSIAIGVHREAYAFDNNGVVYALNLDTAVLTAVVDFGSFYFYSFAYDRATGQFYALSESGDVYLFNRAALTLDYVGSVPVLVQYSYGLQFDSSGLLWYVDTNGSLTVLNSATLADLANPVESGPLVWGEDDNYYSFSLVITRPVVPELAATGSDASTFGAGALAGAMLLLLGAGAVVVGRRRTA